MVCEYVPQDAPEPLTVESKNLYVLARSVEVPHERPAADVDVNMCQYRQQSEYQGIQDKEVPSPVCLE